MSERHGLDPCCFMTTWSVTQNKEGSKRLHMVLTQRSSDYLVAGHINKMQYTALQVLIAREVGMGLGTFTHFVNNLHIYDRHIEIARKLIRRYEEEVLHAAVKPGISFTVSRTSLEKIMPNDFVIAGYNPLSPLEEKLEIAI